MKRTASIKTKLLGLIVILIIAMMGVSGYTILKFKSTESEAHYEKLNEVTAYDSDMLEKIMNTHIRALQIIANGPAVKGDDTNAAISYLKDEIREQTSHKENLFDNFGLIELDGMAANTDDEAVDLGSRGYFKAIVNGQDFAFSDPIISKVTNQPAVVVAVPVNKGGQLVKVLYSRLDLSLINEKVINMKFGEKGRAYMIDEKGIFVAHPNKELLLKDGTKTSELISEVVAENIKKITDTKNGKVEYVFNGIDSVVEYHSIPSTNWILAIVAERDEFFADVNAIMYKLVVIFVVVSLLMLTLGWLLTNRLIRPITELVNSAEMASSGDLNAKIDIKSNDEIGALASSFEKMIGNLKQMIGDVQNTSNQLASHSQELASSSEEVSATMEEVASTTNEVASTSAQGAENADAAAHESEQVQQVAEEGNKAVQETVEKINSIAYSSENASKSVNKLGKQSEEIGQIISTITNIAEQTNLLALNAAIEAARAGEHGKGFAVVADEVRKLAEQSAQAANEITDLVKEIQTGVGEAVTVMEHGASDVNEGVEIANNAGVALEQIIKAVQKNTLMIQDIATGAKQASEGTLQLSSANQQITSTVQQVSGSAQELSGIAEELQNIVSKFKV
ncbi:MAG: HAMP domain-containing protein [Firmicutes bacterium]|nr:HAMP domain-containing protein [Bacillota bacterium]